MNRTRRIVIAFFAIRAEFSGSLFFFRRGEELVVIFRHALLLPELDHSRDLFLCDEWRMNALHTFDPSIIIIGGSVSLMGNVLMDRVRTVVRERALPPYRNTPITVAALGDDCGLLGAAAWAWQLVDAKQPA